jgi:septum formation protein
LRPAAVMTALRVFTGDQSAASGTVNPVCRPVENRQHECALQAGSRTLYTPWVHLNLPPLVLASASPRRSELLRRLGLEFQVAPSAATEAHPEQLTAREVASVNACRKARVVAAKMPHALVLGADTLVSVDHWLLGKPSTLAEAEQMLQELQGRTHEVVTAICLVHESRHRLLVFSDTTLVTFRPLTAPEIRRYLSAVNPLDKAGAYAIQEKGDWIVSRIEGSYSNVMGLPIERLAAELCSWPAGS